MTLQRSGAAWLLALALAACGGGGDTDDAGSGGGGSVPLQTKGDALRELSLLSGVVTVVALSRGDTGTGGLAGIDIRLPTSENCPQGGSTQTEESVRTRSFEHYPTSQVVNFSRTRQDACRYQFDNGNQKDSFTNSGVFETGVGPLAGDGYIYSYSSAGEGATPYTSGYQRLDSQGAPVAGTAYTSEVVGLSELRRRDGEEDFRAAFAIVRSGNVRRELGIGRADAPFRLNRTNNLSLDGEYRYSTPRCAGGTVQVSTPNPLSTAQNGALNGGTLRFQSDGLDVRFTFQLDGSAVLQLGDGSTEAVPANEIDFVVRNSVC